MSRMGGSRGGHDPRAHGKIRYIVRSFGTWAGGKHSICTKRLPAEHPEVCKSPAGCAALCAWLKDQWAGTTKWRNKSPSAEKRVIAAARESEVPIGRLMRLYDSLDPGVPALTAVLMEAMADAEEQGIRLSESDARLAEAASDYLATPDELLEALGRIDWATEQHLAEGRLTASQRRASATIKRDGGKFPIPDKGHARAALARLNQSDLSSEEKAKVIARARKVLGSKRAR